MITKLVLFLCLFCPVPDKERAILEDALSRCSSLERIGEIMDIVERHHLEYRIPVHPPVHRFHRISSAYGWRSDPVTGQRRFHSGVDIAAELASTVHAAADGKVIYSGRKGGYGYCVMIRHAYGFVTLYGHLSACYVPEGEEVRSGKVIGFIGSSGKSTGNHLHYEVRKYGRPVRPYIRKRRGYGYCVMIRHAYGFVTLYGHLSACYVPEGEEVRSGKVIGFIGSSGKSTGNHLHYEVRKYGRPVRPYIRKRRGL